MRVFFLSDLHLRSGDDEAARRVVAFTRKIPAPGDTVILGGDIFDLFVGNKPVFLTRFAPVLSALRALAARGVKLHYLEGNHDFHVEKVFAGMPGAEVHADDFSIVVDGGKILVSHGDMIDPEDRGYRLLRAVTRHPLFRLFLALLPGAFVAGIGGASSRESRKYNHEETGGEEGRQRLRGLYQAFAAKRVAEEGFRHVLVGHSHLADQVEVGGGEYINLGFSSRALPYAVLEPGKTRFEVRTYP